MRDFLIPMTLIFAFSLFSSCEVAAQADTRIEKYLTHFFAKVRPSRLTNAMKIVPVVVRESRTAGFDPLLVVVLISLESSFKMDVVGDIGEIGLLQVHGTCARGYSLDTAESQIKAGVACLVLSRGQCDGSLKQTITQYASGRCVSKSKRTKRMIDRRIRIYEKWRGME